MIGKRGEVRKMEEETQTQNKSSKTVGIIALVFALLFVGGVVYAVVSQGQKKEEVKQEAVTEESKNEAPPAATGGSAVEEKEVKTFNVDGSPFAFSLKEIRVKKGDTVKIVFTNKAGMHDFILDELNAKTKQLKAGESEEVTFVADKAGTFEYYCSVGNHRQQGMVGKLVIE